MTIWQMVGGLGLHIPVESMTDDQLDNVIRSINAFMEEHFSRLEHDGTGGRIAVLGVDGHVIKPSLFYLKRPRSTFLNDETDEIAGTPRRRRAKP